MKTRLFLTAFIAAIAVVLFFSCKSAPPAPEKLTAQTQQPAPEPTPQPAPEVKPSTDELDAAIARAEESRKKAITFEGPSYFPSEWEAAEERFAQAGETPGPEAYNAAADAYDSVSELAIPLYAQAREDEIMAVRDTLVALGLKNSFPGYLASADKTALSALDQYEAGDYYAAADTAANALSEYQVLETAYDAWLIRREIIERDFGDYDPDNFDRAGQILGDAMDAFDAGNIAEARESAEDSLERYEIVLAAGWTAYADDRSSMAEAERQAALEMKTDIAVKDLFDEGDSNRRTGQTSLENKRYEDASKQFINAEAMYVISSMSALEKRRRAIEAIREANDKIRESDRTGRRGETIIEGGSR